MDNLEFLKKSIPDGVTLIAVSKTKPADQILEAYNAGQRIFGENRVQELLQKKPLLPSDIEWHLIGQLQTNKVKQVLPHVALIHSVDSVRLLNEIGKEARKQNIQANVLLEIRIAKETSKAGMSEEEAQQLLASHDSGGLVRIRGLMGIATNSKNMELVSSEFTRLSEFYRNLKDMYKFDVLSIGMSQDYGLAMQAGATHIRVGSLIFGERS